MLTFEQILNDAEFKLSQPDILFEQRVRNLHTALTAEGILPTRRAIQHGESHTKFVAAMVLAADSGVFDMQLMRSTTLLALLGSAGMPGFLDKMVSLGFLESDSSDCKALGVVTVTDKLRSLCPPITLEDLVAMGE